MKSITRAIAINGDHVNAAAFLTDWIDLRCCKPQPNFRFNLFIKMRDKSAVAFGPGHQWSGFGARRSHSRAKIEETGPRARLIDCHSIVVSARIVDKPTKPL